MTVVSFTHNNNRVEVNQERDEKYTVVHFEVKDGVLFPRFNQNNLTLEQATELFDNRISELKDENRTEL